MRCPLRHSDDGLHVLVGSGAGRRVDLIGEVRHPAGEPALRAARRRPLRPAQGIRLLADEDRKRFDVSSMPVAIHAAASCPVEVNRQMMEWWGPVLWEHYAGTELNGFCLVRPDEWLERPGTVGRPLIGSLHIVDPDGEELPAGGPGTIYFGGGPAYEYHNAPDKTAASKDPGGHGWTTLGDVGYLDDDGWLFLTDRQAFMIISGGVNIYPQEIEDCLTMHQKVADVAVSGSPTTRWARRCRLRSSPPKRSPVTKRWPLSCAPTHANTSLMTSVRQASSSTINYPGSPPASSTNTNCAPRTGTAGRH